MSALSATFFQSSLLRALVSVGVAGLGMYMYYKLTHPCACHNPGGANSQSHDHGHSHGAHSHSHGHGTSHGINAGFADENMHVSHHAQKFESKEREIFVKSQPLVDALQIAPGSKVADVGCGSGIFLAPLAKAVGVTGHVYGLDAFPKMIEYLRQKVDLMPDNQKQVITIHQNTQADLGNNVQSLDLVITINTYHHFESPEPIIKSIYSKLKSNGRLLIVDYDKRDGSEWVMAHIRQTREICIREVTACGFVLEKDLKEEVGMKENYALVFKKVTV